MSYRTSYRSLKQQTKMAILSELMLDRKQAGEMLLLAHQIVEAVEDSLAKLEEAKRANDLLVRN